MTKPATMPSGICSPIIAKRRSSQYLEEWLFGILRVYLAPSCNYGSSQTGLMPFTKTCRFVPYGIAVGLRMCWYISQKSCTVSKDVISWSSDGSKPSCFFLKVYSLIKAHRLYSCWSLVFLVIARSASACSFCYGA